MLERRATAGHTLIELMVVLAIIAVVAAVVGPELWRAAETGPSKAVTTIQGVYDATREAAVTRGTVAVVQLDLDSGAYTSLIATGPSSWDTLGVGQISDDGVRLIGPAGSWVVARFDALGRGRGDPLSIVGGGERHTVTPNVWTGGTRVSRR